MTADGRMTDVVEVLVGKRRSRGRWNGAAATLDA